MGIDASIYGQLRQPEPFNPLAEMAQFQQLQGAQNQNKLFGLQFAASERAQQDQQRMRGIYAGGAQGQALENQLLQGGFADQALKFGADRRANAKLDAETGLAGAATQAKVFDNYKAMLGTVQDPQQAAQFITSSYRDPVVGPILQRFGSLEEGLQRLQQATADPQSFAQWKATAAIGIEKLAEMSKVSIANNGGANQAVITNPALGTSAPVGAAMPITQSADNAASQQTALAGQRSTAATAAAGQQRMAADAAAGRGVQLQVAGMADARARDKNSIDQSAVGKVDWKQDTDGNWIALPKEVKTGDAVTPIATTAPGKRAVQAGHALDIIAEARGLIDKGTGSYAGTAIDQAARVVGASTKGGEIAAKLKALEGALMMAQPRMEGPQSNMDVLLYRQMAGQIGDSTLPAGNKKAAIDTIEKLHTKYKNAGQPSPARPAESAGNFSDAEKEARYQAWKAKQK